jgi:transcriptional regulator with XRE-family HTH domain
MKTGSRSITPIASFINMINKTNLLKKCRKESNFVLQDVATLLDIDPGNLTRYESGKRLPTPEVLLTYHILFGASLIELMQPLYERVIKNMKQRSLRLIPQLIAMQTPKSKQRVAYLQRLVNELSIQNSHEE